MSRNNLILPSIGDSDREMTDFHEESDKNTSEGNITTPRQELNRNQLPAWQQRVIQHNESRAGSTSTSAENYEVVNRQDTDEENAHDVCRLGRSIHPHFVAYPPCQDESRASSSPTPSEQAYQLSQLFQPATVGSSFATSVEPSSCSSPIPGAKIWTPSSQGDTTVYNKPKCPPCVRAKKGDCKGGPPCSYCVERNLTAEECQSFEKLARLRAQKKGTTFN
jgi:hypothetical protein